MANIGFIGLGRMGGPMARNIIKAGHTVAVYDASQDTLDTFRDTNAKRATSPRDAAEGTTAVVTCLPTSTDVHSAVLGTDGAAEGMAPGAVVIDTTTANPMESKATAAALAKKGLGMIDAALARPYWDAEAGTMVFLVGGSEADIAAARPILETMGSELIVCGPQGSGTTVKVINNYMTVMGSVIAGEALALGRKQGIDRDLLVNVLQQTVAGRGALNVVYPVRVLAGDLSPLFAYRLAHKDLGLSLELGRELGVPLKSGEGGYETMSEGEKFGRMDQDFSAVLLVLEEMMGLEPSVKEDG
jgi:4-hydroxybutyrate dehydrogenase/sulfolactaldehyde 3-reductase